MNFENLNNKEKKIKQFIADYKLQNVKLRFSKKFRNDFLKICGLEKDTDTNFADIEMRIKLLKMYWKIKI